LIALIPARTEPHLDALTKAMFNKAAATSTGDDTVVTNARHYEALRMVDQSLKDILLGLDAGVSTDLLALDVRRCLHYLGEITGEITNEDQLDCIFSKFCIGK
jgi:tRNA modification GTPase